MVELSRSVIFLVGCILASHLGVGHATLKKAMVQAKKAQAKGLTGYALIDACDVWSGERMTDGQKSGAPYDIPAKLIDALGDKDGKAKLKDWKKAGLPDNHFPYFDKNSDGILDDNEAASWFFQRKWAPQMNVSEAANPPKGHMEHLGAWKEPLPSEHLIYTKPYPHPREFWAKHMDGYLPAILKGSQHGWPAMNWTKEDLIQRFGWVDAKLEPKIEGRDNDTAYAELDKVAPGHRLSVAEYLRQEEGKNMYVVSILPQAMAWEVAHPSVLLCGSRTKMLNKESETPYKQKKHDYPHELGYPWMTHIFEANLWMATGKTRSQLHYDKEWNVNCLLSGKKRWFFLNPFSYEKEIQWARGGQFKKDDPLNNKWTDWMYLDPDHVDLIVHNKLRNMDYYELIQEAGDCLFIPFSMMHQVEKIGDELQVAVSWMFLPETIYNEEDCKDAPLQEDLPMGVMDVLYTYSGKGVIPQGYPEPLQFMKALRSSMKKAGEKVLSVERLTKQVSKGDAMLNTHKDKKNRIKKLFALLTSYAKDPSKGLLREELDSSVPLRVWCKPASEGDDEGPMPCDDGLEYEILNNTAYERIANYIKTIPKTENEFVKPSLMKRQFPIDRRTYAVKGGKKSRPEL